MAESKPVKMRISSWHPSLQIHISVRAKDPTWSDCHCPCPSPNSSLHTLPLCHSPGTHLPPNYPSNIFCTLFLTSSSWNVLSDTLLAPWHTSFKSLPAYPPFPLSLSDYSLQHYKLLWPLALLTSLNPAWLFLFVNMYHLPGLPRGH